MCNRDRAIRFPFDDINCHEKKFEKIKPSYKWSQQTFVNNDDGFEKFCNIIFKILGKYVLRKPKHARGSQIPFMITNVFGKQ